MSSKKTDQTTQVLRWLEAKGYRKTKTQLDLEIEDSREETTSSAAVLREVDTASHFPDVNCAVGQEALPVLCAVLSAATCVLASRGDSKAAYAVLDVILRLTPSADPHLLHLRQRISVCEQERSSGGGDGCAGSAAAKVVHRAVAPRHVVRAVSGHFDRKKLAFLASLLSDPSRVCVTPPDEAGEPTEGAAGSFEVLAPQEQIDNLRHPHSASRRKRKRTEVEPPGSADGAYSLLLEVFQESTPVCFSHTGWHPDGTAETPPFIVAACGTRLNVAKGSYTRPRREGEHDGEEEEQEEDPEIVGMETGALITKVGVLSDTLLLSTDEKGRVRLWTNDIERVASYVHSETALVSLSTLRHSPSLFAVGTCHGDVALWSTEHCAAPLRLFRHEWHGQPPGESSWACEAPPVCARIVSAVALHASGNTVASASGASVRLWDVRSARPQVALSLGSSLTACGFFEAPDGSPLLAVGKSDASLAIADLRAGKLRHVPLPGIPAAISCDVDGSRLAIACFDGGEPKATTLGHRNVCVTYSEANTAMHKPPAHLGLGCVFNVQWAADHILLCAAAYPEQT